MTRKHLKDIVKFIPGVSHRSKNALLFHLGSRPSIDDILGKSERILEAGHRVKRRIFRLSEESR
jgi:hypothetical protein